MLNALIYRDGAYQLPARTVSEKTIPGERNYLD